LLFAGARDRNVVLDAEAHRDLAQGVGVDLEVELVRGTAIARLDRHLHRGLGWYASRDCAARQEIVHPAAVGLDGIEDLCNREADLSRFPRHSGALKLVFATPAPGCFPRKRPARLR